MSDPTPAAPARQRLAFLFVFVTVMLDMLAVGIIIPVLPNLILEFQGGSFTQAAQLAGPLAALWSLMQFLSSPVLGGISDRFGRRAVILYSNLGIALAYVVTALAPNIWVLALGRIISGISAASQSTAQAYIADTSPPEKRAARYGMLGAAFATGFVLGPAIGGLVSTHFGLRAAFWLAAGMSTLNFCYGLFILPESLPKERRRPFQIKQANPLASLRFLGEHPGLRGLSITHFFFFLAQVALPSTFVLYAGYRFGWRPDQVGGVLALVGGAAIVVQAVLVRKIVPKVGERRALLIGLSAAAMAFAIYGTAAIGPLIFIGVAFGAFSGLYTPSAQALMTSQIDATQQGRLQGALSAVASMAGLIGPILFTQLFAFFISDMAPAHVPGAAFYMASLLMLTAACIAWRAMRRTNFPHAPPKAAAASEAVETARP